MLEAVLISLAGGLLGILPANHAARLNPAEPLRQAVELALEQSPDVALARLEEKKAEQSVRQAKDPFVPKLVAGSGLAYSSGFPMSLEGATPSIVQAAASSNVFNRPQSYRIATARENRRRAALELARARRREQALESQRAALETALAEVLGLEPEALQAALAHSQELRLLESKLLAKGYAAAVERARLTLLHHTGALLPALKGSA